MDIENDRLKKFLKKSVFEPELSEKNIPSENLTNIEAFQQGKFPETESLTHQVGPYVGDVGSEGKKVKKRKNGIPGA